MYPKDSLGMLTMEKRDRKGAEKGLCFPPAPRYLL